MKKCKIRVKDQSPVDRNKKYEEKKMNDDRRDVNFYYPA
jgi:hypothetical protein